MIIFENEKFLEDIRKNGIRATDQNAEFKIKYLIYDLVLNSSYRKNKIIDIVKALASDYFNGLPENIVINKLEEFYNNAKTRILVQDFTESHKNKVITLYESEMKTIAELKDDKLMRLAFSALVLHKFTGQYSDDGDEKYWKDVKACRADIYRIAQFDNVSGTTKYKLWKQLFDMGLVKYSAKVNSGWIFHSDWIVFETFTVPFNVDLKDDKTNENIYKRITNYDDVLLYLRYWLKDENLIECADCGCPILRTASAKCLCSNCAVRRKKASDKARYKRKLAIA